MDDFFTDDQTTRPQTKPSAAVAPFDANEAKQFQEAWSKHLAVPVVSTNSLGMRLVLIPPGEFDMGISQEQLGPLPPQWSAERKRESVDRIMNMTGALDAAATNQICHSLHQLLNAMHAFTFSFQESDIPENGIYVLFEDGEAAHGTNRIVRIGTHTGNNQLRSRLRQHYLNENKDRSIFRKNIGRCLLNQDNDPFLADWERDLTSQAARAKFSKVDSKKQNEVERRVSQYIRKHLRFVTFEVQDKEKRLELESRLISTVSLCDNCGPSAAWLGRHSPKNKIASSGLWQVNELRKTPMSADELQELRRLLSG